MPPTSVLMSESDTFTATLAPTAVLLPVANALALVSVAPSSLACTTTAPEVTFTASLWPSSSPLTLKEGFSSASAFAVVVTFVPAAIFATTSLSTMNTDTEASTPMSFSESSSVSVPSNGSVPAVA